MRPSPSTTVQEPVLSQYFNEYVESAATRLAGLQVLPLVNVPDRNGDIMVMRREHTLKDERDLERDFRGTYPRGEWDYERMSYDCREYGIEFGLDDGETTRNETWMEIRQNTAKMAIDTLLRRQENRIEAEVFNATTFSGYTASATAEWDKVSTGLPVATIETYKQTIADTCLLYTSPSPRDS